ncbi:MAG: hypothetical protein DI585_01040 [Pseudomonas fluorescens]|nr:MAG: hypothetical protein DI585_01040 [Pseudomonas fluorescens]
MKHLLLTLATCALLTSPHAQERAAGGALETQMTWSALSSQIGAVKNDHEMLKAVVDQITTCGKSGRFYAPGTAGADGSGCSAAATTARLSCRIVDGTQNPEPHRASYASCNSDEIMTGGGASAERSGSGLCGSTSRGMLHRSSPWSANTWMVDAYDDVNGHEACTQAFAICCRVIQ